MDPFDLCLPHAACANGEVAPFVGHNAYVLSASCIHNVHANTFGIMRSFLRWQAVQDAAFIDRDGKEKIWSESHVSEDFDMALRLQMRGYIIRWATYTKCGFKEGVSLTVDDELNRWQKYAYGECLRSHLCFFLPTTDECSGCSECVGLLSQLVLCTNC
jgi:hypothetical protein